MNILFINKDKVLPTNGGTERITYSVGRALKNMYGYKIYSMYMFDTPEACPNIFEDTYLFHREFLADEVKQYVEKNSINAVIVQGFFDLIEDISNGIASTSARLIFVHHFEPGWELRFNRFGDYWSRMRGSSGIQLFKNLLHCALYPFSRLTYVSDLHRSYKKAYELSACVVLLSGSFVCDYMDFAGLKEKSKFKIIPNILSYDQPLQEVRLTHKKNKILVVSRMDEVQKRISLVLKIWERCVKLELFKDWSLDIVGAGPDLNKYIRMVEDEKIQGVKFHGRQDPAEYYISSSIFMMTSKSEGWGLTLTEAQYFGVIPIAMDTYSSLHDIITDGQNGFIVPDGDIDMFVERLSGLVMNREWRQTVSSRCINSTTRFSSTNVGKLWYDLLHS